MDHLENKSTPELLTLHGAVMEALRQRGVVRSSNNPTGGLAEYLFCAAYGWDRAPNSKKGYDATDKEYIRYQIKGRRLHCRNKSRQMSAIRDLDGFDVLAAVLFDDDYRIVRAALIPAAVVHDRSTYVARTNSHKFILRDDVWDVPGIIDATERLRTVEKA